MNSRRHERVLLSVHGIRTTGRWQKQLIEATDEAGITYRPLDFGYFMALSLLLPNARRKKIEWFRHECEEKLRGFDESVPVSIVAHSFGSYLLAGALRKYSDLKFDRIILCGSIVHRDYPWTSIINDRSQANAVLNEAGGKDFWAGIVSWVVADAGQSGVSGFLDLAGGARDATPSCGASSQRLLLFRELPKGLDTFSSRKRCGDGESGRFTSYKLAIYINGIHDRCAADSGFLRSE